LDFKGFNRHNLINGLIDMLASLNIIPFPIRVGRLKEKAA
jgi:hypothetical protein